MDMIERWQARIDAAQTETSVNIGGVILLRVRYGTDYPDGKPQCRDCGVEHGQLHVRTCCVERCPKCGGQAISCPCTDPH